MQLYRFEKIYSQMEKEFGKIRKGEEETYAMLLLPMEGNVLKIHRKCPESNSRRIREAIALALFDVKGNYSGEKHSGSNGYFDFIEGYMGKEITGNDMNFSIMSSGVLDM